MEPSNKLSATQAAGLLFIIAGIVFLVPAFITGQIIFYGLASVFIVIGAVFLAISKSTG